MEIEYELTPDDLYAFQWRAVRRASGGWRAGLKSYAPLFVVLLFVTLLLAIGEDGFALSRVNLTAFAVVFTAVALGSWFLDRRHTRLAILELLAQEKPGKGVVGRHRVRLTETGVLESTEVGETHTSWAGVDRVEQDDAYLFIYITPHSAHVIPRRAFRSPLEADRFYALARTSKAAAE